MEKRLEDVIENPMTIWPVLVSCFADIFGIRTWMHMTRASIVLLSRRVGRLRVVLICAWVLELNVVD